METVSLKMDGELLKQIDATLKSNRYSTRTEFIRDAIRSRLSELEKGQALLKLAQFQGSLKGKAQLRMTDERAREAVFSELVKKFNL